MAFLHTQREDEVFPVGFSLDPPLGLEPNICLVPLKGFDESTPHPVTVDKQSTPLKFNMEPKNQPLEEEIPFGNHHFQVPC